jgi:hypothetical protein
MSEFYLIELLLIPKLWEMGVSSFTINALHQREYKEIYYEYTTNLI